MRLAWLAAALAFAACAQRPILPAAGEITAPPQAPVVAGHSGKPDAETAALRGLREAIDRAGQPPLRYQPEGAP